MTILIPIFNVLVIHIVLNLLALLLFNFLGPFVHDVLEILSDINFLQVFQLEGLSVLFPHIFTLSETVEVEDQMHQFLVCLVFIERNDWDAIVQLIAEGVHCVVDYDHILEISVGDDPQILDIDTLIGSDAVVSVETILNKLPLRVKVIKYNIRIGFVTGCEYYNLVGLVGLLEAFQSVRSDVDSSSYCFTIRESNLDFLVASIPFNIVYAVDQGLIQIKDYGFLHVREIERWELH